MFQLHLDHPTQRGCKVLCLGAHSDDIEIGCGGTILRLLDAYPDAEVRWVVFSATGQRRREAQKSAKAFLKGARTSKVVLRSFRESHFPSREEEIKDCFESIKRSFSPDVVLTHYRQDLHQDHRVVSQLTWNTFRNHLILEYEIPKYDGDLGVPNTFVPLNSATCQAKVKNLIAHFQSQHDRQWFTEDLFLSLLRLRGMECNASSRYAEAFYSRKLVL